LRTFNRYFTALLFLAFCFAGTKAQKIGVLDEIIAVVGESVILKSDLDKEFYQLLAQYPEYDGNLKCELFDQLLAQKLLLYKADLDSIVVGEDRLEYEINRRIEYYASQAGGIDKLEKYLGIPIIQYKSEMRKKVKEQMLITEAQNSLLGDLKVSPTEVRKFYDEIPDDSIPVFSAEVEVSQLVMKPSPSKVADEYAYETAKKLRGELVRGERDFCLVASIYSGDHGTKDVCGNLGDFKRGQMVPAFEAAAFRLKKDSISKVVKSKFGYHIIQLIERKGEIVNARHILIMPSILNIDHEKTTTELKRIKNLVANDSITWCEAVSTYALEEFSQGGCGFFTDPNIGSTIIEVTALDPEIALRVEKMKPGEVTSPHGVPQPDGTTNYRLLYLKTENPPHKASLDKDYQKIAAYALEKKKQDVLNEWSVSFRKNMYIWIDEKYFVCDGIQEWVSTGKM
jgi:peptidyl-prolyl cis-trans isomerase SurA